MNSQAETYAEQISKGVDFSLIDAMKISGRVFLNKQPVRHRMPLDELGDLLLATLDAGGTAQLVFDDTSFFNVKSDSPNNDSFIFECGTVKA